MIKKDSVQINSRNKYILAVLASLFILSLGLIIFWFSLPRQAVVYLETGDIYLGKLILFPMPRLEDPWYLQRDPEKGVAINPVSSTIWKPKSPMFLNSKQIVFWSELSEESTAFKVINSSGGQPQTPQP